MLELEQKIIAAHQTLADGLLQAGLENDRRPLRAIPENMSWQFTEDDTLNLAFSLPAGSYATVLLREIVTASA